MLRAFEIAGDAVFMKDDKHRDSPESAELIEDPSAKFAYDLATKPPIKDVASVKAASDIFDANPKEGPSEQSSPQNPVGPIDRDSAGE